MGEAAILDRIDELTDDEKVVAELKRELGNKQGVEWQYRPGCFGIKSYSESV